MLKRHKYKFLKNKQNVIGSAINLYRVEKGLSAQKLSDKLMTMGIDMHRQAIFAIEAGKRIVTDYELCIIAEALGVSVETLLKDFTEEIRKEYK